MMKSFIFIFCFANVNLILGDEGKCVERMKNIIPMHKCCKEPEFFDEKEIAPLIEELKRKYESNPALLHCMVEQEMMKKLGLEKVDKAEYKKFIQKHVKEAPWIPVMEKAIDICVDKLPEFEAIYQKAYNLTKEQCDTKFCFLFDCFPVVDFLNCPADSWTKSDQCETAKKFVTDCQNDDSFYEYVHKE
ncbi:hypothetical protein PVAND_000212 [Polypedilum vanderplanki]|uniref:Odorant binding protein n=1 Tax=Polypedilum vanderplanki TaxID=319348 RepID=A0A9J6BJM0_POLVA|nr:hypothetical protein PVAND_000212 [Polypedilum vanderplanki]